MFWRNTTGLKVYLWRFNITLTIYDLLFNFVYMFDTLESEQADRKSK